MKIISFVSKFNFPNQQKFRNFVLNIDNPKLIKKELDFIHNTTKLYNIKFISLVNKLPLYNNSQLLAFLIHQRIYHTFDAIKFDFAILYSRLNLGFKLYNEYIKNNNEIKSLTVQKINNLLLFLWFSILDKKIKFNDNTFLSIMYGLVPFQISKTFKFTKLLKNNFNILKYSNLNDINFQVDFISKISNQFNIEL